MTKGADELMKIQSDAWNEGVGWLSAVMNIDVAEFSERLNENPYRSEQ